MALNSLGVDVPAGTDMFDPDGDMRTLGGSLAGRIVVPVANETDRDALATTLTPTPAAPLYVHRADAPVTARLEWTEDGSTWHVINSASDTGVVACALTGGWTGVCNAQMVGKLIEVRFDLTGGSAANSTSINNVATIPAGFPAPVGSHARGAGVAVGFAVTSYVLMSGGQIGFSNFSGATRTAIAGSVFYMAA